MNKIMCCLCCCFQPQDSHDKPKGELKVVKYKRSGSIRKAVCGNEACTICLEEFQKDEKIQLTPCNHGYHVECLKTWLTLKTNCPMCQTRLTNDHCDEHSPLISSWRIDV